MDKFDMKQEQQGKRDVGHDVSTLNSLLGTLNNPNITGADVPRGAKTKAEVPRPNLEGQDATPAPDPIPQAPAAPPKPAPPPLPAPPPPVVDKGKDLSRIFFTGKLMCGKDWIAEHVGAHILGYAEPLYAVQQHFFPETEKTTPGARTFLQQIGQWGRGFISGKYPLTPERALMAQFLREHGVSLFGSGVNWKSFGLDDNIWSDALIEKVTAYLEQNPGATVAVTNVRFQNELKRLMLDGWMHFHVTCSPATWTRRLAKAGLKPESPEARDASEALAHALDADVTKRISQGTGKKMRVIWCDNDVPCPNPRLYTIDEFAALVKPAVAVAPVEQVDLGDVTLED
jgi:hypothetical protein